MRGVLQGLAGTDAVRSDHGGPPWVAPASAERAAAVLECASVEGWRVWPAGGGSRRPAGRARADLVLSTERITGLTVYEPEDLTLGCRAGTPHGMLADAVAGHRQLLPLDPAAGAIATAGGTLALADAGPLRAGYGAPRDLALGVTAITGDGRVVTFGGRVVKNVAGYDLVRLLVGSRGTLALITELHLRLRSAPEQDLTLLLECAGAAGAAEAGALALAVRDAAAPAALEVLTPDAPAGGWQLAVRLHGSAAAVAEYARRVVALAPGACTLEAGRATAWWAALAAREHAAPVRIRLTVLPDRIGALLAGIEACLVAWPAAAPGTYGAAAVGHGTEGIVRVLLPHPAPGGAAAECLAELGRTAVSLGGTWRYDRGREAVAAPPAPPDRPAVLARLERDLKAQLDPRGVLPELEP